MLHTTKNRLLPLLLAPALAGLVACGGATDDDTTAAGDATTTVPGTSEADDGEETPAGDLAWNEEDVVFRLTNEGGFTTVETNLRQTAMVTVTGDGTVYAPGVTTMEFPGPAVLPISVGELTDDQITELLTAAQSYGLTSGEIEYGQPPVADAGTTVLTITLADGSVTHAAPALGMDDGVDPDQAEAREALQSFVDELSAMATENATELLTPDAYVLYASPYGEAPADVEATEAEWPLADVDPLAGEAAAAGWTCTVVEGDAAATLTDAFAEANELTRWMLPDGDEARIVGAALLPGGDGCPDDTASADDEPTPGDDEADSEADAGAAADSGVAPPADGEE
ncbi:MAG: hypothetical protein S0880_12360 [Actinomycetota bacterium]|nr:hypothetical protein [Actinomycetota bacterium]